MEVKNKEEAGGVLGIAIDTKKRARGRKVSPVSVPFSSLSTHRRQISAQSSIPCACDLASSRRYFHHGNKEIGIGKKKRKRGGKDFARSFLKTCIISSLLFIFQKCKAKRNIQNCISFFRANTPHSYPHPFSSLLGIYSISYKLQRYNLVPTPVEG